MDDAFMITVGRRSYRRFIPYPQPVTDGTLRCIGCGQIDEQSYHDSACCPAAGGALPLTERAAAFLAANESSPVVYGSAQKRGGAYYRLADGQTFRLSLYEVRALPMPRWDLPA